LPLTFKNRQKGHPHGGLFYQWTALHLGLGKVPVARVDGLELAAVDRNTRFAERRKASA
jgi:hypothetical protein